MANPEHLAILKQGTEAWNRWQAQNRDIPADLVGASLNGDDFRGAEFYHADLRLANLCSTDLTRANLRGANLRGARLQGANLVSTDLTGAHLDEADLHGANLVGANLSAAILVRSNLPEVFLFRTLFADTDMSGATGLVACKHVGPSTIDHRTIRKSDGLPLEFLRGCGLGDLEIEFAKLYQPDLTSDQITDITYRIHRLRSGGVAVQFYSCFISYSTKDQEFAERIYRDLQNEGVRCWFAPHDIKAGRKIHQQVDEAIHSYDRLLLILSAHSMNSEWVKSEIAKARKRELREERQMLFPVSLVPYEAIRNWECFDADTGKDSAREIREYFIPDFSNWKDHDSYQTSIQRLLRDLKPALTEPPEVIN